MHAAIKTPSTGDIKNLLLQLYAELKSAKFKGHLDPHELSTGIPAVYLQLIHFILLEAFPLFTAEIVNRGFDLRGKRDQRFMETVYRLLRDEFSYKPSITRDQFFHFGFGARKIIFLIDVITNVKLRLEDIHRRRLLTNTRPHPPEFSPDSPFTDISMTIPAPLSSVPIPSSPPVCGSFTNSHVPCLDLDHRPGEHSQHGTSYSETDVSSVLAHVTASISALDSTLKEMQLRLDKLEQAHDRTLANLQQAQAEKLQLREQNLILRNDNTRLALSLSAIQNAHPTTDGGSLPPIVSTPVMEAPPTPVKPRPVSPPISKPSYGSANSLMLSLPNVNPKLKAQIEEADQLRRAINEQLSATQALLAHRGRPVLK